MSAQRTGVLVMAYGTPRGPEDIEAYYTHIRHGRAPSPEALAELTGRYDAIGGSPLARITDAQVAGIARHLPEGTPVALGLKHSAPYIEDGVDELLAAGVTDVVGLVLAPHYSRGSIGQYFSRARERMEGSATFHGVESWATEPGLVELLAGKVRDALDAAGGADGIEVLFTAHSLPQRIVDAGDRYPDELRATAEAVAEAAGIDCWSIAWQSAGRTPEPWIGPDVLDALADVAARGRRGAVVCAAGFVSDHLEVLYDLDIEAAARAKELGIVFGRTTSANDDERFTSMLAGVVERASEGTLQPA